MSGPHSNIGGRNDHVVGLDDPTHAATTALSALLPPQNRSLFRGLLLGASGGIVVTPIGVQQGGQLIAEAADIQIVHLDADSTTTGYLLKFLGNVFVGPRGATLTLTGGVPGVTVAPSKPNECEPIKHHRSGAQVAYRHRNERR